MPNLFIIMLGGRHARANIEVHDVILAVGETLEETYDQLRNAWFGEQKGLHIDAWAKINGVEHLGKSYKIQFSQAQPKLTDPKLWLINLGGYDEKEFGELHRYVLIVAKNAVDAKAQAKTQFASHWQKKHTDRVLDVDDCIAIDHIHGRYIQLVEGQFEANIWQNDYLMVNSESLS